jgi:hypothetical protein
VERSFQISRLRFQLRAPDGAVASALASAWRPFETREPADLLIDVDTSAGRRPRSAREPLILPRVDATPEGGLRLEGSGYEVAVTPGRERAQVRGFDEAQPVESLVKILLAERLLAWRGLLVHGVAVASGASALLFTGQSGAGKSTLGALCARAGLAVLADELVAVVPGEGGYTCEGTPWNVGGPGSARLAGVGLLAWAEDARVEVAEPAAVLRVLLSNCVMADPSPEGRARMFEVGTVLLGAVRCVRLHFARDERVAQALVAAL